jgi:hypothetical protein
LNTNALIVEDYVCGEVPAKPTSKI